MNGGYFYEEPGSRDDTEPSPLGDRTDLHRLSRKHLLWSMYNEVHAALLAAIGGRWFNSQAVIALHYSALHLLDTWLVGEKEIVCTTHEQQDAAIARYKELRETLVGECYREIRAYSEKARYRMRGYSRAQYEYILEYQYRPIKRELVRLIIQSKLATREEISHKVTLFDEVKDS